MTVWVLPQAKSVAIRITALAKIFPGQAISNANVFLLPYEVREVCRHIPCGGL